MFTENQIQQMGEQYLNELKARGRKFNPIKFTVKKRKSGTVFGTAVYSFISLGYDEIQINPYIVNEKELKNTILHELAHCDLEARGDGHGNKWVRVALHYNDWFNVNITRTSNKELIIPGGAKVKVTWNTNCLALNKRIPKEYIRSFPSLNKANSFVEKYKRINFIEKYEIILS